MDNSRVLVTRAFKHLRSCGCVRAHVTIQSVFFKIYNSSNRRRCLSSINICSTDTARIFCSLIILLTYTFVYYIYAYIWRIIHKPRSLQVYSVFDNEEDRRRRTTIFTTLRRQMSREMNSGSREFTRRLKFAIIRAFSRLILCS